MEIQFITPTEADLQDLQVVHNKAFLEDYLNYGECPGYGRTIESLRESMKRNTQFKIVADGRTVGKVSGHMEGEKAHIDCLCVIPEYQHRGIGQQAIQYIEKHFANAKGWVLETPKNKKRNVSFYHHCGYVIQGEMQDENVLLVILAKEKRQSIRTLV